MQLAAQVQQAQAEERRSAEEAARLEQQLQRQSAAVAKVAKRRRAVQQHKCVSGRIDGGFSWSSCGDVLQQLFLSHCAQQCKL